jgi:hypothetical protein
MWHCWKALNKGYNFALNLISIRGLHTKLWAPKVAGIPAETKWHLGVGPMAKHRIYYKGEGGGFLQVQAVVSLVSPCLPIVRPCTKVLQLCTNQIIVKFVQVCVSDWIAYQSSQSHSKAPAHPYIPKMLWAKKCTPIFSPFAILVFGLVVESIKELGGASC